MTNQLPPLPEPVAWNCDWRADNDSPGWAEWYNADDPMPAKWIGTPPDEVTPVFTAEQMHAYAREALAKQPAQARQPLTDEQIAEICIECAQVSPSDIYFARAVEAAHGITAAPESALQRMQRLRAEYNAALAAHDAEYDAATGEGK